MTDKSSKFDIFLQHILASTLDALPVAPNLSPEDQQAQREAAAAQLAALQPQDAIAAMRAARAVAAHHAAMECFRRAALPEVSDVMAMRLQDTAAALSRLALEAVKMSAPRKARAGDATPDATPAEPWPQAQDLLPDDNLPLRADIAEPVAGLPPSASAVPPASVSPATRIPRLSPTTSVAGHA
jgi:hypothetical protein